MRRLPASPNLEHLKGQARSLLRAFLAGDAAAQERFAAHLIRPADPAADGRRIRLADAQFVLAWEYGFPSWARLKTFVEAARQSPAAPPASADRRSARRQFLHELAVSLVDASRQRDSQALGSQFAIPLRDILAVREHLALTGELSVVVDGLLGGLGHPQPWVRFACAGALDHFADNRCFVPLRHLLSDPVPRVRRAALHSLTCDACKLSPLGAEEDLVPVITDLALNDPSVRVRRAAVPLLESHFQDGRVGETLRTLALDADLTIRRAARQVLRRRSALPEDLT